MYRRLVTFALIVVTVSVTALVIPLTLSARDLVRAGNLSALADRARTVADAWESIDRRAVEEDEGDVPVIDPPGPPGEIVLVYPDGTVVGGPVPARASAIVDSALAGRSTSVDTGTSGYASAPATFDDEAIGAVLAAATPDQMQAGLGSRVAALAGLCAVLLVGAGLGAWLLARRTARPIRDLARTADAIASGDLTARVAPSAIGEVDDVGHALNRLATRVQELLDEERAATAELAHQLRTPLTVLAGDVDSVTDPQVRQRLSEDVLTLQATTDEIISSARRTSREGLHAACDAVSVVAARAEFWRVLADYQGRAMQVVGAGTDAQFVRLTEYDLATAVDILLQNVFTHTEEATPLRVSVVGRPTGEVEVTVEDGGPGFSAEQPSQARPEQPSQARPEQPSQGRPGSTNLGLAIADRLARASGGHLDRGTSPLGGARVTLVLGPAVA